MLLLVVPHESRPTMLSTRDIAQISALAALTAALGLIPAITVPIAGGVPITAQSLGPMLAGAVLGRRKGGLAVVLFLVLVAIGLPLLPGGRGGLGVFQGPSAGFLLSWPVAAYVIGIGIERLWSRLNAVNAFLVIVAGGVGLVYLIGIPWVSMRTGAPLLAVAGGSALYVPGDLIKATIATLVALTVKKSYPLITARA